MATRVLVDTDSTQTVDAKTLTGATISSPVLSGTATGTYTLGGTPTISAPTITSPSVTGILTVAGHIKFPATANPSADPNTLDDYEEGSWTPSLGGTAAYTIQTGAYIKIGPLVFFNLQLTVSTIGTGSTSTISGLPFTCGALERPINIGVYSSLATSVVSLYGRVNIAATTLTLSGSTAAATNNTGTSTIFGNSTAISISGFYTI